jgi:hypothetical protein
MRNKKIQIARNSSKIGRPTGPRDGRDDPIGGSAKVWIRAKHGRRTRRPVSRPLHCPYAAGPVGASRSEAAARTSRYGLHPQPAMAKPPRPGRRRVALDVLRTPPAIHRDGDIAQRIGTVAKGVVRKLPSVGIDLIPIVAKRLQPICAARAVEPHGGKCVRTALMPSATESRGTMRTRQPVLRASSSMLRPVVMLPSLRL